MSYGIYLLSESEGFKMDDYIPIEDIILGMAEIVYENRRLRKENLRLLKEQKEHEEFAQNIFKSTQERQINLLNLLCGNKGE